MEKEILCHITGEKLEVVDVRSLPECDGELNDTWLSVFEDDSLRVAEILRANEGNAYH